MGQAEYLTIADAMRILKVSRLSIYRHMRAGRLRAYRVGRLVRITRGDLDDFVKSSRHRRASK